MTKRAGYCRAAGSDRELLVSHVRAASVKRENRAAGDESKVFRGYGAVFYREGDAGTEYWLWSDEVERIMPGAFDRVLSENQDVRGLFNHNPDNLLGSVGGGTMRIGVDSVGLHYEIDEDPDDPDSQRVARKIDRNDLTGSSFSFIPEVVTWRQEGDIYVRQIEEFRAVFDVGPVTFPAYTGSTAGRSDDGGERRAAMPQIVTERESFRRERIDAANQLTMAGVTARRAELGLPLR